MTKEQEIIKSFLMSDFHWVDIDTEGGFASGNSCKRIFEGIVCAKGKLHNFEFIGESKKALKKWKNIDECKEWLPENILHKSIKSYSIDKTGKEKCYHQLIKNIDADTRLLLQITQGSIGGVGYNNGCVIIVGIIYKNFIFKLYSYKSSQDKFEINALYDIDYIRSLDFSDMKKLNTTIDLYIAEYSAIRICNSTSTQDMADVLSLVTNDGIFTISDEFQHIFSDTSCECFFNKETLLTLQPKKIILQENFDLESIFNIPDSLEEIVLDFRSNIYATDGILEQFIDSNKKLGKYIKCSDDCEKINAREIYIKEVALLNEPVNIWFNYKELSGFVHTNKYQLGLFEDFYRDAEEVLLKVGDAEFSMPIKKFWSCLQIDKDKKIKNKKSLEKAIEFFDDKIGYTAWFPTEVEKNPLYTGKTKISTKKFTEELEKKETKRTKKESFKKNASISKEEILPALKDDETLEDVILESIEDVTHDMFYDPDGLDDEGADVTNVFKIGDAFYEVDLHCEANWVGDWSVRKNLPGDVSVEAMREIKKFKIEKETEDYIELKY